VEIAKDALENKELARAAFEFPRYIPPTEETFAVLIKVDVTVTGEQIEVVRASDGGLKRFLGGAAACRGAAGYLLEGTEIVVESYTKISDNGQVPAWDRSYTPAPKQ
jgi:hypothetical protein